MLIGESLAEIARKAAAKEAAHLEELRYSRRLATLAALGAFTLGLLLGLAL